MCLSRSSSVCFFNATLSIKMPRVVGTFRGLYSFNRNCLLNGETVDSRSPRLQRTSSSFASRTPSWTPCSPACLPAATRSDRRKSAPSYSTDRPSDHCEYNFMSTISAQDLLCNLEGQWKSKGFNFMAAMYITVGFDFGLDLF